MESSIRPGRTVLPLNRKIQIAAGYRASFRTAGGSVISSDGKVATDFRFTRGRERKLRRENVTLLQGRLSFRVGQAQTGLHVYFNTLALRSGPAAFTLTGAADGNNATVAVEENEVGVRENAICLVDDLPREAIRRRGPVVAGQNRSFSLKFDDRWCRFADYPTMVAHFQKQLDQNLSAGAAPATLLVDYSNLARSHAYNRNYDKALRVNQDGLKLADKSQEAEWTAILADNIGTVYQDQKSWSQALIHYVKAVEAYRQAGLSFENTYNNIGNLYFFGKGDSEQGLEHYNRALAECKKQGIRGILLAGIFNNIAIVYIARRDLDPSLENFKYSLRENQNAGVTGLPLGILYDNIGEAYRKKNDRQNALLNYKKAVEAYEARGVTGALLGKSYAHMGDMYVLKPNYPVAIAHFRLARTEFQRAGLDFMVEQCDEKIEAAREKIASASPENKKLRAEIEATWERYIQSVVARDEAAAEKLITRSSKNQFALLLGWTLYGKNEELEVLPFAHHIQVIEARARLEPADLRKIETGGSNLFSLGIRQGWGEHSPEHKILNVKRVGVSFVLAELSDGGMFFNKEDGVWKLNFHRLHLATSHALSSEIQKAGISRKEFLGEIAKPISKGRDLFAPPLLRPGPGVKPDFFYFRMAFLGLNGNRKAELQGWTDMIRDFPQEARPYLSRGLIYGRKGEDQKAWEDFNAYVARAPDDPVGYRYRGTALSDLGRMEEAKRDLEKALRMNPKSPGTMNSLAWHYALSGKNLEEGLRLSRASLKAEPNELSYHDTMAEILFRMGKIEESEKISAELLNNERLSDSLRKSIQKRRKKIEKLKRK